MQLRSLSMSSSIPKMQVHRPVAPAALGAGFRATRPLGQSRSRTSTHQPAASSRIRSVSESSRSQPLHQDKDVTIWEAGTAEAEGLVKAARWTGLDDPRIFDVSGPSSPHLSPDLHGKLDVVVVKSSVLEWPVGEDKARFCALSRNECPPGVDRWDLRDFNTQFLLQRGFRLVSRSCVVLHVPDQDAGEAASAGSSNTEGKIVYATRAGIIKRKQELQQQRQRAPLPPRILCLFINGNTLPELSAAVSAHHSLYDSMSECFYPSDDRPGLFMAGIRCNDRQGRPSSRSPMPPGALNVGYYTARSYDARLSLSNPNSMVHVSVLTTCGAITKMEKVVAPFVAQRRRGVADLLQHPGILPDIPRQQVSGLAVGVSKGFTNHIHADQMYGGLTGTITWNTSRMQPGAGHTFCVWSGKLLFDLQAHHASMVMIPGDVPHGTPGLPPPPPPPSASSLELPASSQPSGTGAQGSVKQLHEGIGVVVITTDNLSTDSAKEQLHLLHRRINDPGPYGRSFERFRGGRLFMSRSAMYCRLCGEGGRPVPCGDKLCTMARQGPVKGRWQRQRQWEGGRSPGDSGSSGSIREDGGGRR